MLEFFTYKKVKKHKEAKKAKEEEEQARAKAADGRKDSGVEGTKDEQHSPRAEARVSSDSDTPPPLPERPVLDRSDESFLQHILSDDSSDPERPDAVTVPDLDLPADDSSLMSTEKDKEDPKGKKKEKHKDNHNEKDKEKKDKDGNKSHRFSFFSKGKKHGDTLKPEDAAEPSVPEDEVQREKKDLNRVLDRLNLSSQNNKVISLSNESAELLQKFTQIFKDLANGVPTAYDDLVRLITDRDGAITRGFEKLPKSLQKLVTQLPEKLTSTIAPEVLAAAAKSQGIEMAAEVGVKEAAQKMFMPQNLLELLTKPGALVGMLRAIVTALRARWPAFIGLNVIWSVALFLLMFVLWYCHKRGREERLEKEKAEAEGGISESDRIEELPDDPLLPEPKPETTRIDGTPADASSAGAPTAPPPAAQRDAPESSRRSQ